CWCAEPGTEAAGIDLATTYPCYMLPGEPVVDGVIDEKEWDGIPEAHGFYRLGSDQLAIEKQTAFKAAWTRDALFLAVRCEESCTDEIVAKFKDGGNLWEEDSIEFYFVPPSCKRFLQFVANARGSRWPQLGADSHNPGATWAAVAKIDKNGWSLEVKIPFALLAATPGDGEQWKVNVARNMLKQPATERITCWSPLSEIALNDVPNFNGFVFYGKSVTRAEALKVEGTLACNNYWSGNIRSIPAQADKYNDGINAALRKDSMKNDAAVLRESWSALVKTAGKQNLTEMECRRAVQEYRQLAGQSDLLMNRIELDRQQAMLDAALVAGRTNAADGKEGRTAEIVARKDYDASPEWQPRQIMGRDFWHILGASQDTQPDKGNWVGTHMRELVDKPLFKESGLSYGCDLTISVPNSNKVSISAMTPHRYLELIETRPEAPFFLMPSAVRFTCVLMKYFECDNDDYAAWKKAHPNFMGCVSGETDNDFWMKVPWNNWGWPRIKDALEKKGDKELIETIEREFPKPQNRVELAAQFMKGLKAVPGYFFNDADKLNYMSAASCLDHYFYENGAGVVWRETTNTASPDGIRNYRHQTSLFFT
ncbi:MAG: sugar-binding protein, partial [Lentisphaerota bacterium]